MQPSTIILICALVFFPLLMKRRSSKALQMIKAGQPIKVVYVINKDFELKDPAVVVHVSFVGGDLILKGKDNLRIPIAEIEEVQFHPQASASFRAKMFEIKTRNISLKIVATEFVLGKMFVSGNSSRTIALYNHLKSLTKI